MQINAYATHEPGGRLEPFSYNDPELAAGDVLVRITHCAIGRGDVHFIDNDWEGLSKYPLVPGHEMVGTVDKVGNGVSHLSPGDRVGVGYQVSSCGSCDLCRQSREHLCKQQQAFCLNRYGGFADYVVAGSKFIFPVPDNLPPAQAAPLLCSGLTVYEAIKLNNIKQGMNVGVIGIGGLGHLAVQFLAQMGHEVTAFSHTPDKEQAARKLGAHEFINTVDGRAPDNLSGRYDFLLSTVNADLGWDSFIKLLSPSGKLHFVGIPLSKVSFSVDLLNDFAQRSLSGSYIGSPATMREMLPFAAKHNILAQVETMPVSDINDAVDITRQGKARFRIVLENN